MAIESPTYFGILHALETLGLQALEIPTHPTEGISIEALSFAVEHHPVKAVVVVSNYNNPLGSCIATDNKKELVELLARHDIPLLENDINGELYFGDQRPLVAKSFDKKGLVLLMSSFSKDISPSYRVGWRSQNFWTAGVMTTTCAKFAGFMPKRWPRWRMRSTVIFQTARVLLRRKAALSCGCRCRKKWIRWCFTSGR